jgi:hypothetical protein
MPKNSNWTRTSKTCSITATVIMSHKKLYETWTSETLLTATFFAPQTARPESRTCNNKQ